MSAASQDFSAIRAAQACADARRVLTNLWDGAFGVSYALTLIGVRIDPTHLGHPPSVDPQVDLRAAQIAATNAQHLREATLFVADPDLVDLIDTAAPTMPDQRLAESDLIAPSGFLWFSEPLPDRTGQDPVIPIAALAWTTVAPDHPLMEARGDGETPGVFIHTYARLRDMDGFPGHDDPRLRDIPGLFPSSSTAWTIGSLIGEAFGQAPPSERYQPGFYQRVAAAFWTLAQQPLTMAAEAPPGDKTTRKKATRLGVTAPSAPVRVITLRRSERAQRHHDESDETSGRKVGVRFVTRGHWRNQWLPSRKAHRQQWIAAHWRGPEDGPVQGGEKVFLAKGR